ncbi:MAG TPA: SCO1664 family protein [Micromonosporaceae bacterium]
MRLLTDGEIELEGRLVDASNTTLRGFVRLGELTARCVYKPVRGERPLWDFPDGTLAGREVAAYLLCEASGWNLVPPTVLRDGPLGEGACQLWLDEPEDAPPLVGFVPADNLPPGWLSVASARDEAGAAYLLAHADDTGLARMALFDAVVNNADRKGGHVLHLGDGRLYGVDHGVCFHVEDKLRTVLWGFVGRPLPAPEAQVLAGLATELRGALGQRLAELISAEEVEAAAARVDRLLAQGCFPDPVPGWPAVPWPPI